MLSGISLTCFVASYLVALALEVSRLFFRSGVRGAVMLGFAAAGLFAHTLFLANRVVQSETTSYDWYLLAAWFLSAVYLYLTCYFSKTPSGLLLLPLVLALIAAAASLADERPVPLGRVSLVWGMIHGGLFLAGTVVVMVGFLAGVLYLIQDYRLKRHRSVAGRLQLPSLETLRRINERTIVASVLLLLPGFLASVALNVVNHRREVDQLSWQDPVVWSSSLLVGWMVAAAVFNAVYRPAREGHKVAYLTVASFFFLVLALGLQLVLPSEHGSSHSGSVGLAHTRQTSHMLAQPSAKVTAVYETSPASRRSLGHNRHWCKSLRQQNPRRGFVDCRHLRPSWDIASVALKTSCSGRGELA